VLDLVFQYYTKRLAGKYVSEMTYFVSGGTQNLNSIYNITLNGCIVLYEHHTVFASNRSICNRCFRCDSSYMQL